MSVLNLESLLAPVTADNPFGENLEYDAEFMELERMSQGKPERVMGSETIAAEPPEWREVARTAESLFKRTKDLRVAVQLTRAALGQHGFAGLDDALRIVAQLVRDNWDQVHPRLDAEDDNDPTLRVNSLLPLADRNGFVAALRGTPLVKSVLLGQFAFRDYQIANGDIARPEGVEGLPDTVQIEAAFQDAALDALQQTGAALEGANGSIAAIVTTFADKVGSAAPALEPLQKTVAEMHRFVTAQLAKRGVGTIEAAPEGASGVAGKVGVPGQIGSRDDVIAALERVCEYYRKHEPSSPVPYLLRRAQRLVPMDFMEILKDMTPSGVAEAETISGAKPQS